MNKVVSALFTGTITFMLLPYASSAQTITTYAGCGVGDDSLATKAELFYPHATAVDAAGNIYIADALNERVRKISTSGIITTIAGTGVGGYGGDGGPATAANLDYPAGVTVDKAGNLYIGDEYNNRVRKVSTSGIISTYAGTGTEALSGDGNPATAADIQYPIGVSMDTAGNLYIADAGNARIRKVSATGIITTVAGISTAGYAGDNGPATAAEIYDPFAVVADNKGNFYIADKDNERIRKVNAAGIITTIAGTGTPSYSGDNGPATAAEIRNPNGVTIDSIGNIYFSDAQNFRVRKIDTFGIITTVGGNGTASYGGDGGPATAAEFSAPSGLTIDKYGNLFIADDWNNRVRKLATTTGIVTTVAGQNGLFGEGYNAINAEMSPPDNVAVDNAGNLYIADIYNNRIRMVSAATGVITTVAGNGISNPYNGFLGDGGPAVSGQLYYPASMAIDATGNIYIADEENYRVRKVNTSGIITTIAGNGTGAFSGDGGPATAAELYYPAGIAVDTSGNVYIVDVLNYRIRKINTSGIITTVAGNGAQGYGGDGVAATATEIRPADVAVDLAGNLYIADGSNNRIRMVDTAGIIHTFAGNGSAGFNGDGGAATLARINSPGGVKVDAWGDVWISDNNNNRIRMVDPTGTISTIAGNGTPGYAGDGGLPTAAELNGPAGVAIDLSGNVYIADGYNYRVRKVTTTLSVPKISKTVTGDIFIYPNPAVSTLTISATGIILTLDVTNITGQVVYRNEYHSQMAQIDVSGFPAGVYLIRVNGSMTKKFVKE